MKNKTGKKITVIDELDIKGSGLYCFLPFERLDKHKKAVFKVGIATRSYNSRVEQYHTYLPKGVYMVAFLENPPLPPTLRNTTKQVTLKMRYLEIEKFIVNNEGETEWVYTNEDTIHKAFREASAKFGGTVKTFTLESINDNAKENENKKPNYVGEIVFHY